MASLPSALTSRTHQNFSGNSLSWGLPFNLVWAGRWWTCPYSEVRGRRAQQEN
jgi:hypothetical protein